MRKIVTLAAAAALAALMALAPAAIARHGHASCTRADRNHDSIPDKWECKNRLSLRVKQTRRDPDHDGLNNLKEFKRGTNPRKADTDGDGIRDGAEVSRGLNPRSDDSDRDGVDDENELAGTIVSFDQGTDNDPSTGTLTITPAGGGDPVSGQVTAATRIECEGAEEFENDDAHSTTTARRPLRRQQRPRQHRQRPGQRQQRRRQRSREPDREPGPLHHGGPDAEHHGPRGQAGERRVHQGRAGQVARQSSRSGR
jgi:hypothetical protein